MTSKASESLMGTEELSKRLIPIIKQIRPRLPEFDISEGSRKELISILTRDEPWPSAIDPFPERWRTSLFEMTDTLDVVIAKVKTCSYGYSTKQSNSRPIAASIKSNSFPKKIVNFINPIQSRISNNSDSGVTSILSLPKNKKDCNPPQGTNDYVEPNSKQYQQKRCRDGPFFPIRRTRKKKIIMYNPPRCCQCDIPTDLDQPMAGQPLGEYYQDSTRKVENFICLYHNNEEWQKNRQRSCRCECHRERRVMGGVEFMLEKQKTRLNLDNTKNREDSDYVMMSPSSQESDYLIMKNPPELIAQKEKERTTKKIERVKEQILPKRKWDDRRKNWTANRLEPVNDHDCTVFYILGTLVADNYRVAIFSQNVTRFSWESTIHLRAGGFFKPEIEYLCSYERKFIEKGIKDGMLMKAAKQMKKYNLQLEPIIEVPSHSISMTYFERSRRKMAFLQVYFKLYREYNKEARNNQSNRIAGIVKKGYNEAIGFVQDKIWSFLGL